MQGGKNLSGLGFPLSESDDEEDIEGKNLFFFKLLFLFFLYIILTYVPTLYLLLTRCLHYINLHYLQYIYYNTITPVKLNYSWSIYVIVCMVIVPVTNKNFFC